MSAWNTELSRSLVLIINNNEPHNSPRTGVLHNSLRVEQEMRWTQFGSAKRLCLLYQNSEKSNPAEITQYQYL